jgi:hypothetical protein
MSLNFLGQLLKSATTDIFSLSKLRFVSSLIVASICLFLSAIVITSSSLLPLLASGSNLNIFLESSTTTTTVGYFGGSITVLFFFLPFFSFKFWD